MNKETIYRKLQEYVSTLEQSEAEFIGKIAETGITGRPTTMLGLYTMGDLLYQLKQDIQAENAKANGKQDIYRAAKAIIKNSQKVTPNTALHGAFMIDGQQYVCDSYRILRLKEPIELPEAPTQFENNRISEIIDGAMNFSILLNMPTIGELKTFIKTSTDSKPLLDLGEGKPCVNAKYLLDMLLAMPEAEVYYDGNIFKPLYFKADGLDGVLLPTKK